MNATPEQLFQAYTQLNQELLSNFMQNFTGGEQPPQNKLTQQSWMEGLLKGNEKWLESQKRYYQQQMELFQSMLSHDPTKVPKVKAESNDRRFQSPEWEAYPYFDYLKQSYLLTSKWMQEMVDNAAVDDETKKKMAFFTRQYLDALSPANFPGTNPEVLKMAIETKGESLTQGMKNLMADMEKGRISMTDESAFEIGRNIAMTPGAVVYENELIQLIQYTPTTETVAERPLLIVPPCINKYYILDLQPENSFVRYGLEQGQTVFLVSWRNIPEGMGHITWDDYLSMGVMQAIDVTREISGTPKINALGFCVGGALLSCALAVMRSNKENKVASVTLLTTLLDYQDSGEIACYIDKNYMVSREDGLKAGGLVSGKELSLSFASLRANELIWHYVVNNYLKGKTPPPFDLLYWNSDSTNLPGVMYAYYIRNLYIDNSLREPNKLTMCGTPVDLGKINLPTYIFAAKEDHIVPWKSAYESTQLLKGDLQFVLGGSGHIAGVVNPAAKNKRNYWTGGELIEDAEHWLETAESKPGSWWPHWAKWLKAKGGKQVPARTKLGNEKYKVIESAPGRFVTTRSDS